MYLIGQGHSACRNADFPLFEWDESEQRLVAMHHPFTAGNPEDTQAGNGASHRTARALAYDLVYNGVEIAGNQLPAPSFSSCREHSLEPGCMLLSRACRMVHWPEPYEKQWHSCAAQRPFSRVVRA